MLHWSIVQKRIFAAFALALIVWSGSGARLAHSGNASSGPSLTARLVDERRNAAKDAASVEVTVRGIRLVDPSLSSKARGPIEGHLHYQLDDGAIIATTAPQLSFHQLSPGEHKISIHLTDGNHIPIGMPVVLTVRVPTVETVLAY
jgi:hypothetical protein